MSKRAVYNSQGRIKTAIEVHGNLADIMTAFSSLIDKGVTSARVTIDNVGFNELIKLHQWAMAHDHKCRLYMPGEQFNECLLLEYRPAPGFYIVVESEHAINFKAKPNLIHYN